MLSHRHKEHCLADAAFLTAFLANKPTKKPGADRAGKRHQISDGVVVRSGGIKRPIKSNVSFIAICLNDDCRSTSPHRG